MLTAGQVSNYWETGFAVQLRSATLEGETMEKSKKKRQRQDAEIDGSTKSKLAITEHESERPLEKSREKLKVDGTEISTGETEEAEED